RTCVSIPAPAGGLGSVPFSPSGVVSFDAASPSTSPPALGVVLALALAPARPRVLLDSSVSSPAPFLSPLASSSPAPVPARLRPSIASSSPVPAPARPRPPLASSSPAPAPARPRPPESSPLSVSALPSAAEPLPLPSPRDGGPDRGFVPGGGGGGGVALVCGMSSTPATSR